jgi:hypothetical protein
MSKYITKMRQHPCVEYVDDEVDIGNGVIVTLKAGWSFDSHQDNRVMGADTDREALELVLFRARQFKGELTS